MYKTSYNKPYRKQSFSISDAKLKKMSIKSLRSLQLNAVRYKNAALVSKITTIIVAKSKKRKPAHKKIFGFL